MRAILLVAVTIKDVAIRNDVLAKLAKGEPLEEP